MTNERYEVVLSGGAQNDMDARPGLYPRIANALLTLEDRPERGHPLTGALRGCRSLILSHSQGGFRAVYILRRAQRRCVVLAVGPHATVYAVAAQRYAAL